MYEVDAQEKNRHVRMCLSVADGRVWEPKGKAADVGWEFSQERFNLIVAGPSEGVTVAFEAPAAFMSRSDVRTEMTKYNGLDVVRILYLKVCQICQKSLSKCECQTPDVKETWLYDRALGINQALINRLQKRRQ